MKFPKASIIIATLNNCKILERELEVMHRLPYPDDFEIIVVNDGSSDGTREMLARVSKKSRIMKVVNLPRSGVCKARNTAIRLARFPIIVNMDHDCIPEKNWLKDIVRPFENPKVGIVSSYEYYGGTSTAFRKELLEKVGGYDEDYFYFREDTDVSFKIMELGYEFLLLDNAEKARFLHDHEAVRPKGITGLIRYTLRRLAYHQNDALLFKKHPTKVCRDFLHIKFNLAVNPLTDFKTVTGLWSDDGEFSLSSPQGITFVENRTALHTALILLVGAVYVFAVTGFRIFGSIKWGKLLL